MHRTGPAARLSILTLIGGGALLSACSSNGKGAGGSVGFIPVEVEVEAEPPVLELTVGETAVLAGDLVPWELVLVYPDGVVEPAPGASIQSNLEPLHFAAGGELIPHMAGDHVLTASAMVDGERQQLLADLSVSVAATAVVDLSLTDQAFAAGEGVGWTIEAWDAYGNAVSTGGAVPDLGDAPLTLSGGSIEGEVPGAYTVDALVEGVMDSEVVVVTPAAPADVTLSLSDTDLELFETTSATVSVVDAYGNPTTAPWTLSVIGTDVTSDDYAVSWNNITFYDEGVFTVRVDVDGTSLYDEVGPLTIDSTGPDIIIDQPDRGDWHDGLDGTVSGTVDDEHSGVTSLTVDGDSVSVSADGSFSHDLTYDWGVTVLDTEAVDADGNVSTDTRAVLAGDFIEWGETVPAGFMVRLEDGPGGLDTLETLGEEVVADIDLAALIPSPVFSDSEQTCVSVWPFGTYCFTWYALTLYVYNPSFGDVDLELDTRSTGELSGTFTVDDIYLDWYADATVAEIDFDGGGDITADDITVDMSFWPSVDSSGNIDIGLSDVTASTTNFYFDWDSWLYDALDFFGLDSSISGLLESYIETALEDTIEDAVPDLLGDALQDLEIAFDFDLNGVTYAIDAQPEDIILTNWHLILELGTTVEPDVWVKSHTGLGSLYAEYGVVTWPSTDGTHLAMNLDFLNQFFMAAWGGGLLDMELNAADLGLDVADLEVLLPGLTDLNITTEALLPPVVVPDGTAALLELQIGDLLLTLYNGDATPGNEMIQVYVSAFVEMDMDANADGTALIPELGDMDLHFDVVVPEANSAGAADTEALLELLVPLLLPTLTDALTEVPIPDIQGFGLSGVSVDTIGPDDGVLALGGDLVVR